MIEYYNGNVGLGTIYPQQKLDVSGNINFSGNLYQGNQLYKSSQWENSNGIYYDGKVGIGTNFAIKELDVSGNINFSGNLYKNNQLYVSSQWEDASNNQDLYFNRGNIGIGIISPIKELDISGSINVRGDIYQNGSFFIGSNWTKTNITDSYVAGYGTNFYQEITIPSGLSNVIALACGDSFSLALNGDGTVVGWGYNNNGQATIPIGLNNVIKIDAGVYHSLALKNDGTVVGWGANAVGQTTIPVGLTNVIAIAAGDYHSLALKNDGTVVGWGYDNYGQTTIPVGLNNVIGISAGSNFSLALKNDGTVVGWGDNYDGQISIPSGLSNVISISAGNYHSLALKNDGTVVGWGYDSNGQATVPTGLNNVTSISAGGYFSLALKNDGTVVGWGENNFGQLNITSLTNVTSIGAGVSHSLASVNVNVNKLYILNSSVGINTNSPTQSFDLVGNFKQSSNTINIIRTANTSASLTNGSNKYIGIDITWDNTMTNDLATFRITGRCHLIKSDTEYAYRRFEVLVTPKDDISNNKPKLLLTTEASNYITTGFSNLTTTVTRLTSKSIRLKVQWDSTVTSYYGTLQIEVCALDTLGAFTFSAISG
jgi:alpha-tubulin suppressor-like RCC1 family protein